MNDYLLIKFAHIIAFVYWLGGDLGTFIASKQVINRKLSAESRQVALGIMLACDMGPKFAMPLILPLGLQLAHSGGWLILPLPMLLGVWLLSLYWFAVVLILYLNEGKVFTATLGRIDYWFRVFVALGLAAWGLQMIAAHNSGWIGWKLLIFAAMVGCGIAIRYFLTPFLPAFSEMMSKGANDSNNRVMEQSIGRCRPWVWCIWAGLFGNAALGLHLFS